MYIYIKFSCQINIAFQFKYIRYYVASPMTIKHLPGQNFGKLCSALNVPDFKLEQLYIELSRPKYFQSASVVAPECEKFHYDYEKVFRDSFSSVFQV